jgi:hypothetical protein
VTVAGSLVSTSNDAETGRARQLIGVLSDGPSLVTTRHYELAEITTPNNPAANQARLFLKDNGAGKTQLCVRFRTGAVKVLTIEP